MNPKPPIIDFHTHIFPARIRRQREDYFPREPAFRLLYESPKSRLAGAADTIAMMDEEGVDRAVVFGFPWQDPEVMRYHNDYVMEAAARYPRRLIGLGCLAPESPGAVREAERCLAGGLAGLGELAFYRAGIDEAALDRLAPIMALARAREVPVLIHTNEPVGHPYPGKTPVTLGQIYGLVQRFPENTLVLAHWGGGIFFYHLMKREVKPLLERVYFDTAASPFLYDPGIYTVAARTVGIDKVLFGTDFPLLRPSRYFKELEDAGLSEAELAAVLGGNAARLFGLQAGAALDSQAGFKPA